MLNRRITKVTVLDETLTELLEMKQTMALFTVHEADASYKSWVLYNFVFMGWACNWGTKLRREFIAA